MAALGLLIFLEQLECTGRVVPNGMVTVVESVYLTFEGGCGEVW